MAGFFGHPRGLATLFLTEYWERFSYYGMRALLILFMTASVTSGGLGFDVVKAGAIYGIYAGMTYLGALPGGWIADRVMGQRKAVLYGGLIIAAGNYALAIPLLQTFYLGLGLIVLGTGLLKPNVSTMVGQLYGQDHSRRDAGFSIFYMGINLGALVSPLVCSYLGEKINWHLGFAVAGVGMTAGVIQYRLGWKHLANAGAPPTDTSSAKRRLRISLGVASLLLLLVAGLGLAGVFKVTATGLSKSLGLMLLVIVIATFSWLFRMKGWTALERKRLAAVLIFFFASALFWTLFEQAGSTLNLFAELNTNRSLFGGFPAGWFQSEEPLFVILLAPVFAWLWVNLGRWEPSTGSKFALGLLFAGFSFLILAPIAGRTNNSPLWLTWSYLLVTVGELCLSPVGLSVTTKLAPARVAGLMMGFWFLSDSVGNYIGGTLASFYHAIPLPRLFGTVALAAIVAGIAMFLLVPSMKKLMGGVN
jgi:proton-dependent oligopeptide transporter, POT family